MKKTAWLFYLSVILLPIFSFAGYNPHSDDRPVEFLRSIIIGTKNVEFKIPSAYKMVSHDANLHQNSLGFVLDHESPTDWSQYLTVTIVTNTSESASMRVQAIQSFAQSHYHDVKILDVDIHRQSNGVQDAYVSILYTDEGVPQILSAHYYSDSASLVGAEAIKKLSGSISSTRRTADRLVDKVVHLSNT